jgi:hypothetical protein
MASHQFTGEGSNSNSQQRPMTLDLGHGAAQSSTANTNAQGESSAPKKKKKGKRKRGKGGGNRRHSFAVPDDEPSVPPISGGRDEVVGTPRGRPFYKLGHVVGGNLSDTSLDSEVLLDHR